jgi:hypothetical protein
MWQARTDLVKRGYEPKSVTLGAFTEQMTDAEKAYIAQRCTELQDAMIVWGRGWIPNAKFDGTMASLIRCYKTDDDSPYQKGRYKTRRFYDDLLHRIEVDHGHELIRDIKVRNVLRWHEAWVDRGVSMSHQLVGMLRALMSYGTAFQEDDECARVRVVLQQLKFKTAPARTERLTADQANAIRQRAHEDGVPSIALAQAFQFECMLRQKDVIGEWVPVEEPGLSELRARQMIDGRMEDIKWLRGLRWSEIDQNLILRHTTSKRQKDIEINLRNAPMVMEELTKLGDLPGSGPVIVSEYTGKPYIASEFRRRWRQIADKCGIPKSVRNMDSRAGAISEATDAGAELEHVRHAATHGDIKMTQKYSRGAAEKIAVVQELRAKHRNKSGTD